MNQNVDFTIVCEIKNGKLYKLINNKRSKFASGVLSLCWLNSQRINFMSIGEFCQTLFPETPFVSIQGQNELTFLFPDMKEGLNGLTMPKDQGAIFYQKLIQIIQIIPYENAINIQQFKYTIDIHCSDIISNPLENDIEVIEYIQQGGEVAKKGFGWLGNKLSEGINMGGQYLNSKIDKQEQIQVSMETKVKLMLAKQLASDGLVQTSQYLSQLLKPVTDKAKEIHQDVNNKIDSSDNKALKDGKKIAVTTWDTLGVAVSGLGDALSQVGDSISQNTKQCVEKKYGQDVSQTFL